jgi:DNA-binding HxlR family transcriptional regulator
MQHKNIGSAQCPIARSLAQVGEWWSLLIIRDAIAAWWAGTKVILRSG